MVLFDAPRPNDMHIHIRSSRIIFFKMASSVSFSLISCFYCIVHTLHRYTYAGTEILFLAFLIEGMPLRICRSSSYRHGIAAIIIIIIILIHYHKRLTCHRIEYAYRFIGLAFSLHFLFLHSVSQLYIQLCKAIKKNSQPGAGERGGGTGVTCRLCVFMQRMCGGRRPQKGDFQRQWSPWNGCHQGGVRNTSR